MRQAERDHSTPDALRARISIAIEKLITVLDALDAPGTDLEPEEDAGIDDEGEPTMGAAEGNHLYGWRADYFSDECEAELGDVQLGWSDDEDQTTLHADLSGTEREPALGSVGGSQLRWAGGDRDDREDDAGDHGEPEDDLCITDQPHDGECDPPVPFSEEARRAGREAEEALRAIRKRKRRRAPRRRHLPASCSVIGPDGERYVVTAIARRPQ